MPDGEAAEFGFFPSLAALLTDYLAGDAPLARDELAVLNGTAFTALPRWPPDEAERNDKLAAAIQRRLLGLGAAFGPGDSLDRAEDAGRNQLLRALLREAGVDEQRLTTDFIDFRQIAGRLRSAGGGSVGCFAGRICLFHLAISSLKNMRAFTQEPTL